MIGVNDAHQVINIFGVETTTSRLTSFTPDLAITPGRRTRVRERAAQTVMKARERERETEGGEDASRWSASLLMRGSTDTLFLHLTPKNLRALLKALKTKQVSADSLSETALIRLHSQQEND